MTIRAAAILPVLPLFTCARYRAEWNRDGRCLPICAAQLAVDEAQVLGTTKADGSCECDLVNPPPPTTPSCPAPFHGEAAHEPVAHPSEGQPPRRRAAE
jgi:hypothetical protein